MTTRQSAHVTRLRAQGYKRIAVWLDARDQAALATLVTSSGQSLQEAVREAIRQAANRMGERK